MNISDEAHLFLTGYSINLIKSRDLVRNNHYLVTTNLGMLDKFISKHCTHYFLGTEQLFLLIYTQLFHYLFH